MMPVAIMATPTSPMPIDSNMRNILDKLDSLVGTSGCIRSAQEVPKIISLMKETEPSLLLINRCIILNTLHATKAQSTLNKFMEAGGWSVLNVWLSDAKKTQNGPLLAEILQVLQKLPVTIAALKQGNMGKLVKQLSKHESEEVKTLAADILAKWMAIFRDGQAARTKTTPSGDKLEGGPVSDLQSDEATKMKKERDKEDKKAAKKLKKEKELKSPVEAQPPLGPLVALGKPREKPTKRPRDLSIVKPSPPVEKKSKLSPTDEDGDKDKNQKGLMESSSFMNALSSQAAKWQEKRIKKLNKGAKSSPTQIKAPVDVGGSTDTTSSLTKETLMDVSTHPLTNGIDALEKGVDQEDEPMEQEVDETKLTTDDCKMKKRVTWADEPDLVVVHYFEMDESERVNVHTKSFLDAAQHEKQMEREALSAGKMYDQLIEMTQWYRPVLLSISEDVLFVEKGRDSEQKNLEIEREAKVLSQLFLNKASVPPTPVEPDPEPEQIESKPKPIPLLEPGVVPPTGPIFQPPPGPMVGGNQFPPESPLTPPGTPYYFNEMPNNSHPGGLRNVTGPPVPGEPIMGGDPNGFGSGFGYNTSGGGGPSYQFYPDSGGPFRGGHGIPRGRGRGRGRFPRGFPPGMGNICKHYITHGCRLGSSCKFLHITPDELAVKMSQERNEHHNKSFSQSGGTGDPSQRPSDPNQSTIIN